MMRPTIEKSVAVFINYFRDSEAGGDGWAGGRKTGTSGPLMVP
jgi:hypothetical protein